MPNTSAELAHAHGPTPPCPAAAHLCGGEAGPSRSHFPAEALGVSSVLLRRPSKRLWRPAEPLAPNDGGHRRVVQAYAEPRCGAGVEGHEGLPFLDDYWLQPGGGQGKRDRRPSDTAGVYAKAAQACMQDSYLPSTARQASPAEAGQPCAVSSQHCTLQKMSGKTRKNAKGIARQLLPDNLPGTPVA